MKLNKYAVLIMISILATQLTYANENNSKQSDDIVIPAMGVTLDENGKPDTWISVPKNLRSKGTPIQSDDSHIYLEPKQRPSLIKDLFKSNEGVDFQLQQPTIKVGG